MIGTADRTEERVHVWPVFFTALLFFSIFMWTALSLVLSRGIIRYDAQLTALVLSSRTPDLTRLFWVATILADPRVIVPLAFALVLLLLAWGRRSEAVMVVLTLLGGAMLQHVLKMVFDRQRPPTGMALIGEPLSASFPSGHAFGSLMFAGLLTFVLWRTSRGAWARLTTLFAVGLVALAVGASRVYLGVHWVSDVIASWSLAMTVLSAACGGYLILVRHRGLREAWPAWSTPQMRWLAAGLVTLGVIMAVVLGAQANPLLQRQLGTKALVIHGTFATETLNETPIRPKWLDCATPKNWGSCGPSPSRCSPGLRRV